MDWKPITNLVEQLLPVILSGTIAFVVSYVVFISLKFTLIKLRRDESFEVLKSIKAPLLLLVLLLSAYTSAHVQFAELGKVYGQIFQVLLILTGTYLLLSLLPVGRYFILSRYDITAEDNLKARKVYTQIRVFERILGVLIVIIALALALMTFDSIRRIGASILASAGILSVIVGFAAQKLIANLLAGFQIAITQPIRLDDVVIMEGEWGWIEEITLTYVVVRVWDKRRLIIPATQVIEKPFQNWSRTSTDLLGTIFMYLDYRMPISVLRTALDNIIATTDLWDGKAKNIQVTNLTDRTMEVRVLVSAKDAPKAWELRVYLREKLIEFLQKEHPEYLPKTRVELNQLEKNEARQPQEDTNSR